MDIAMLNPSYELGHLGRQRLVFFHGKRRPIEGIAVADLVRRKSLLQCFSCA
jgi:hypothetical protein